MTTRTAARVAAGVRRSASIRLGQPAETLGELRAQVSEASTQVQQLQMMLAPVKAWTETVSDALDQAPWGGDDLAPIVRDITSSDPLRMSDLPDLLQHLDAAGAECERLQSAGEPVQAARATGDAAWHQQH